MSIPNVSKIMAYEAGEMTQEEVVEFFQELLDDGSLYCLQGSYHRMAACLLDGGLIVRK